MKGDYTMLIAAVLMAAVLMFSFGCAQGTQPPSQQPPGGTGQDALASASAKLLLSAFDRGAELQQYAAVYSTNENGALSTYEMVNSGGNAWTRVNGSFGSMQGFFGKDNASDIVCLTYKDSSMCTVAGNDSQAQEVAGSLKILLLNPKAYAGQKATTAKLISAGVIRFSPGIAEAKVGQFDTQKVSYTMDYSNLTVQQIIALGISPNDPTIYSITDWNVAFWIDKKTGMVVKSSASYKENLIPNSYETEYLQLELGPANITSQPVALVEVHTFNAFYTQSVTDYSAINTCAYAPKNDRDGCFKTLATDRLDWEICRKISDPGLYQSCAIIVAQGTRNKVLCEKLATQSDDCYIAVASVTGNYELCKNLKNSSLTKNCADAASEGKRLKDDEEARYLRAVSATNCKASTDCARFGNAGQYCLPQNTPGPFTNESSPALVCLDSVPCGCQGGFCGFAKNQSYYACVNDKETDMLDNYVSQIVSEAKAAANKTNGTNASG